MSQSLLHDPAARGRRHHALRSLLIGLGALGVVLAFGALASWLFGLGLSAPAPKSPFGVGLREGGGDIGGFAGWVLSMQSGFSRAINAALRQLQTDPSASWSLVGFSFVYGVFHAAGPGHGKAVVAAYILASERALRKGLLMAAAAAMLQAIVAVSLVSVLALVIDATAGTMTAVASRIELLSFAAVAAVGAVMLWQKSRSLARQIDAGNGPPRHGHEHHNRHHGHHGHHHHHHHDEACDCGHSHAPVVSEGTGFRAAVSAVVAAGIRPCSGAIVVLVFALSQNLYAMGVIAVFAIAVGTAITTGSLAALAVLAKHTAQRLAGGNGNPRAALFVKILEVLAAAAVTAMGASLMVGALALGPQGG
jgi:nickel/cobalt exporter